MSTQNLPPYQIIEYKPELKQDLARLIVEMQDIIAPMDPHKFCFRAENYIQVVLPILLQNIQENQGKIYFLEIENKLVGIVAGIIEITPPASAVETLVRKAGRVEELYVDPGYQKFGFGKILMTKIQAYFEKNNCQVMRVEAFAPNQKAIGFYQKMGFGPRNIDFMKVLGSV
jgi:ribosomal protein S18 acetylase RimI-like enzyme